MAVQLSIEFDQNAPDEGPDPALLEKREHFSAHYDKQTAYLKDYFARNNYAVAGAFFEILEEKKRDKWRKDGYTPALGHEISQLLTHVTSLEHGMLRDAKENIEAEYGSVEQLLCRTILHDAGENYGVFSSDIRDLVLKRIHEKTGASTTPEQEGLVDSSLASMERLTHYRKYSLDEFRLLAEEAGISIPSTVACLQPDQAVCLDEFVPFFQEKAEWVDNGMTNPRVFARWDEKNKEPQIIVTNYGRSGRPGTDWNRYILTTARDMYDGILKTEDRNRGVDSRLGMDGDSIDQYDRYLTSTAHLFHEMGIHKIMQERFPESPLKKYMQSQYHMMGLLYTMGRVVVNHHPDRNPDGEKVFDTEGLDDPGLDTTTLYFSRFFPQALRAYEHLPRESHPVYIFMYQLREYANANPQMNSMTNTFNFIKKSLLEHGGDTIPELIGDLEITEPQPQQTPAPQAAPDPRNGC